MSVSQIVVIAIYAAAFFTLVIIWAVRSRRQRFRAQFDSAIPVPFRGVTGRSAPDTILISISSGRGLSRHRFAAAIFALTVAALGFLLFLAIGSSDVNSDLLGRPIGILFVFLTVWGASWSRLYIKPLRVEQLRKVFPGRSVWMNMTTAGLRAFVRSDAAEPTSIRLREFGYLVLESEALSLWETRHGAMVRVALLPRSELAAAVAADVAIWTNTIPGVEVRVHETDNDVVIPLVPTPAGFITPRRATLAVQAAAVEIQQWIVGGAKLEG